MVRSIGISRERQKATNTLGVVAIATIVWQGCNTLLLLLLVGLYLNLMGKEPPAMVQLEGGRAIAMEPLNHRQRTPAVIQAFVQDTLTLLLSASGQLPARGDAPPVRDPGVSLETPAGQRRISSLASMASYGLSEDFRVAFLQELGKRTPKEVFQGQAQVILVVQDISAPEPMGEGQWKVTMIANLVTVSKQFPAGNPVPFNKEIFVRSVVPPRIQPYSSALEKQVADVRQAGLEIYSIRNYIAGNPTN